MTELTIMAAGLLPDNEPVRVFDQRQVTLPTGLVLNSEDQVGVLWHLETIEGWDTPASTGRVTQRAYQSGGWADRAFYASRIITLEGVIVAATPALLRDAKDRFAAAIPLDVLEELAVVEAGQSRSVWVRQDGDPILKDISSRASRFSLQLVAPDPRRLRSGPVSSLRTGLPSSSGGLSVAFTIPFSIAATTVAGVLSVFNAGTAPAPGVVRIDGPVQRPVVRHEEQGHELVFDLILDAGQWLEVDLDLHTVLLNGQASRRGLMRGRWFTLTPGVNTISWSSLTAAPTAALTVSWRDAWK